MNPLGKPGMLLSMGVTKGQTLLGDWTITNEPSRFLLHTFSLRLMESQNHKDIRNLMALGINRTLLRTLQVCFHWVM